MEVDLLKKGLEDTQSENAPACASGRRVPKSVKTGQVSSPESEASLLEGSAFARSPVREQRIAHQLGFAI